jgi:hypothetical protein
VNIDRTSVSGGRVSSYCALSNSADLYITVRVCAGQHWVLFCYLRGVTTSVSILSVLRHSAACANS